MNAPATETLNKLVDISHRIDAAPSDAAALAEIKMAVQELIYFTCKTVEEGGSSFWQGDLQRIASRSASVTAFHPNHFSGRLPKRQQG